MLTRASKFIPKEENFISQLILFASEADKHTSAVIMIISYFLRNISNHHVQDNQAREPLGTLSSSFDD
ncbi:hypothetical protein EUGRSUZ_H04450 [Eucalyptus grandis]|uniref:Uncharacterized protein n=2 Tax=Eucalyptus grandis TaxID=71139 RepID=A0ACC3JWM7_EUCGR|nr:hypothetical protein EUGRSUZ_H04450 [Eucalyptus grandis]